MSTTTDPLVIAANNAFDAYTLGDLAARKKMLDASEEILVRAQRENRDTTPEEKAIAHQIIASAQLPTRRSDPGQPANGPGAGVNHRLGSGWIDRQTGKPVACLSKAERIVDHVPSRDGIAAADLSLGRAVVAMITGDWSHAPLERGIYAALGGNLPGGGASMVPDELSAKIIDLARARTVLIQAGAQTVPMHSDWLTMARVVTDPTIQVKAENASFSGSDMTFGSLGFSARTVGQVVTMSRELADDAPNAAMAVETALAGALAVALDSRGLTGNGGSDGFTGLLVSPNIGETTSVGAIAWEDLATAVIDVQSHNGQPNAYIASPTINGDLSLLTSGDGANSAKLWLPPPSIVASLMPLVTSSCPDTSLYVGDFEQFVFAVRLGAQIEVSTQAGDAFEKYQVKIRIVWRGDCGLLQPSHFHRLIGITT